MTASVDGIMERSQLLDAMGQLKLYGMKAAYDEVIATAVKLQHEPQKIVGDLLHAEISEKQARDLAGGDFLEQQRNVVLIGGTGTGKSHLAVGIARACIQGGKRAGSSTWSIG